MRGDLQIRKLGALELHQLLRLDQSLVHQDTALVGEVFAGIGVFVDTLEQRLGKPLVAQAFGGHPVPVDNRDDFVGGVALFQAGAVRPGRALIVAEQVIGKPQVIPGVPVGVVQTRRQRKVRSRLLKTADGQVAVAAVAVGKSVKRVEAESLGIRFHGLLKKHLLGQRNAAAHP